MLYKISIPKWVFDLFDRLPLCITETKLGVRMDYLRACNNLRWRFGWMPLYKLRRFTNF